MKLRFKVLGVTTLPNTLICVTLQNLDVPPEVHVVKDENPGLLNVQGMMQTAMKTAMKEQQKLMGMLKTHSEILLTGDQFEKWRVTIGDEVEFPVEGAKSRE